MSRATGAAYDAVVVGGGTTGTGLLRDLAMRGLRCLLVEQGDLAHGTSGRFHGLLHSGARYAVKDPISAQECMAENLVLRRIAAHCVEDTGGIFCRLRGDPEGYPGQLLAGCQKAGIPISELELGKARAREPLLNSQTEQVFEVPDATIQPFELVAANVRSAQEHGAEVHLYSRLTQVRVQGGRVVAVEVEDIRSGSTQTLETRLLASATGAWAGRVAALAGVRLGMAPGWGTMVIMNQRLTRAVVNRCRMPADGDIIVPVGTVCIAGTTSRTMESPDTYEISREEVLEILEASAQLVPALKEARVLRVYAGARPLYDPGQDHGASRSLTRNHTVLDHAGSGVENLVSVVGGKLTTFRLMAEETANLVCRKLGVVAPCRTHLEPLPGSRPKDHYWLGGRLASNEAQRQGADADLICECELVTGQAVETFVSSAPEPRLEEMLRALRLGMGPCQGAFCSLRAAGIVERTRGRGGTAALTPLKEFLEERLKGNRPILWGDQARQLRLTEIIYREVFNLDRVQA